MKIRPRAHLLLTTIVTSVIVSLIVTPLSRTAFFSNNVELPLYDAHTVLSWPWKTGHQDIVLVTIQKETASTWPLRDGELAEALDHILRGGPSAIVVDIIRPEFRDEESIGRDNLREIAQTTPIVWARSDGGPAGDEFPSPPFIKELGPGFERGHAGLAVFPVDNSPSRKTRRAFVATDGGQLLSLATLAASYYALGKGLSQEDRNQKLNGIGSLRPTDGGYALRPGAGEAGIGDQFLLKFGPHLDKLFPVHSLAEVKLQQNVEELEKLFAGKIVFFGTHDSSTAKDEIPVIGNPELRGVKLHALATAQLLRELLEDEPPIRTSPEWLEIFLIPIFSLFSALLLTVVLLRTSSLRAAWFSAPLLLVGPLLAFVLGWIMMHNGTWLPVGAPLVAATATGGISLAWLLRFQRHEVKSAEGVLHRSAGSQRAEVLLEHRDDILAGKSIPSETFEGSILFSDLADSTRASHLLEAAGGSDAQRRWHDTYMDRMTTLVNAHRSAVDAYLGDGVMARFGDASTKDDTHASTAVRCAIAMREAIAEMNAALDLDDPPYRVRIGVYTGPINRSQRGSGEQIDISHSGTAVNLAKRLEEFDKESFADSAEVVRILVSKRTHQLLDSEFARSPVSPEPVVIDKNTPPVMVWQIEQTH